MQEAGEHAAESQGFAPRWGGHQVCSWAKIWVEKRELPQSTRGHHVKVKSLLDGPHVVAELQTYLWSNKWAMNPGKLAQFSKNQLIPSAADQYLHKIIKCLGDWRDIWSMSCFHEFSWRLAGGFHSAQLVCGCIRKVSGILYMQKDYIMMAMTVPMSSNIARISSWPWWRNTRNSWWNMLWGCG